MTKVLFIIFVLGILSVFDSLAQIRGLPPGAGTTSRVTPAPQKEHKPVRKSEQINKQKVDKLEPQKIYRSVEKSDKKKTDEPVEILMWLFGPSLGIIVGFVIYLVSALAGKRWIIHVATVLTLITGIFATYYVSNGLAGFPFAVLFMATVVLILVHQCCCHISDEPPDLH